VTISFDDILRVRPTAKVFKRGMRRYAAMCCPYHADDRPSLMVYDDGLWNCLGCGRRGLNRDLYDDLVRAGPEPPHAEAVAWVAPALPEDQTEKSRFAFHAHDVLMQHESLQWYLKNRGVEGRIEPCVLGWHNGWYTIPITDDQGDLLGLILRAGSHIQKATGQRFIQPRGQTAMLYVPSWHRFLTKHKVAIVFGMFDALSLDELGFAVCTTTAGMNSLRPEWFEKFGSKSYVLIPDKGEEETAQAYTKRLPRSTVLRLPYEARGLKDPADYLGNGHGEELAKILHPYLGG
jgi:hypothetical protein